jgi:NADPH:quinone reductase-like Zn-dependent oxidoreductase
MKAAVCTRYGPPEVLQLRDVATPVPGRDDLLVRIHAAAVSSSDCYIRSGVPSASFRLRAMLRLFIGFTRPRRPILGAVLAGEVEKIGERATRFRVGDRVYAFTALRFGCYAQFACVPERSIVARAPSHLRHEEAAAIPYGGLIALHFVRLGSIQAGQRVLIYGASGAIGTAALQLAKHFGAHVTAVCSTTNVDLVKSLGADAVLDYTKDRIPEGARYSLVLDAVGRRKTSALKADSRNAITGGGRYISVDDGLPRLRAHDLRLLTELVESGRITPVIDRRYPLERIAEAHRYVEKGHKRGNVVITVP